MNPSPRLVPTLSQLVERLFKVHRDDRGKEYSLRFVALAGSGDVGQTTIHALRSGQNKNPTHQTIQALSLFFGEDPNYFFPELWDRYCPHYWDMWEQYRADHPYLFTA